MGHGDARADAGGPNRPEPVRGCVSAPHGDARADKEVPLPYVAEGALVVKLCDRAAYAMFWNS